MLTAVRIENLRGIARGELHGFAPLTILTGPNGCGKSTVLDAVQLGLGRIPAEEVRRVVQRRPRLVDGARWLVGNPRMPAVVEVKTAMVNQRWRFHWRRLSPETAPSLLKNEKQPFSAIAIRETVESGNVLEQALSWDPSKEGEAPPFDEILFSSDGFGVALWKANAHGYLPNLHLIDPGLPLALDEVFSDAVREGRRREVQDFVRALVPALETLEILKEKDEGSQLYLVTADGAVPVATSGDGVQSFAQLAIELAAIPEGLALIEEPEVYQHPRAIWQSALALLVAMRRGLQIVLSTHSLELIDALLGQATHEELEKIALFNLALDKGQLRSSRASGPDLLFARRTLEHDLR